MALREWLGYVWPCLADETPAFETVTGQVAGRLGSPAAIGRYGLDRLALGRRPQVFLSLVPDHVIAHRMFPLAADRTVVECDWLFDPGVVAPGRDLSASVELFDRVNLQDFDACERCQPSMASRGYAAGGVLVRPSTTWPASTTGRAKWFPAPRSLSLNDKCGTP